jgi:hypothetical protein
VSSRAAVGIVNEKRLSLGPVSVELSADDALPASKHGVKMETVMERSAKRVQRRP